MKHFMTSPLHRSAGTGARAIRPLALAALALMSACSVAPVQPPVPSVPLSAAFAQGGPRPAAGETLDGAWWAGYGDPALTSLRAPVGDVRALATVLSDPVIGGFETRELIKELAGDHTIVLSTHILPEVSQTCQRVVIINKGHVVAVDTPDNLVARLAGSETMYVQVDAGAVATF